MEHETDLYVACFYQKASVLGEFFICCTLLSLLGADPKLHSYEIYGLVISVLIAAERVFH